MSKRPPSVDVTRIESKKIEFQLELRNRFEKLQEICKTIKKKARENIRKYNHEIIRETIMASKSLKKAV